MTCQSVHWDMRRSGVRSSPGEYALFCLSFFSYSAPKLSLKNKRERESLGEISEMSVFRTRTFPKKRQGYGIRVQNAGEKCEKRNKSLLSFSVFFFFFYLCWGAIILWAKIKIIASKIIGWHWFSTFSFFLFLLFFGGGGGGKISSSKRTTKKEIG